jgi:hypothetical protein
MLSTTTLILIAVVVISSLALWGSAKLYDYMHKNDTDEEEDKADQNTREFQAMSQKEAEDSWTRNSVVVVEPIISPITDDTEFLQINEPVAPSIQEIVPDTTLPVTKNKTKVKTPKKPRKTATSTRKKKLKE